jgi:hypothetical protein
MRLLKFEHLVPDEGIALPPGLSPVQDEDLFAYLFLKNVYRHLQDGFSTLSRKTTVHLETIINC